MKRLTLPALLLATACLPGLGHAQVKKTPEGVRIDTGLEYGPHGERNKLDLYRPAKAEGPLPLIIWVHGGGWEAGSKADPPGVKELLTRGYALASINYRLSKQAIYPAQVEDCKAAVRYLRANAKKFNLDPDRFGAWGGSAGGHLVALLGTTAHVKELEGDGRNQGVSSRVQCVLNFFGPSDLTVIAKQTAALNPKFDHEDKNSPGPRLLGGSIQDKKDLAAKANPITFVTKDAAPCLIVHGDKDWLVPLAQGEMLRDAMKKAGADCELMVMKGAGHGGKEFVEPTAVARYLEFFDRHLKAKAPPAK